MTHQVSSELLKLRTARTVAALLLAAAALTLLGTLIEGLSRTAGELAQEDAQRTMFSAGVSAVFFATLAGLIVVTSEFRYGTIRPTLLAEPRRRIVLAAKLAVAALTGVVFALVCVGIAFGAGLAILAARDIHVAVSMAHAVPLVFGTIASSALGAILGVAVGALIRNQAGAIVAIAAYAFLVDAALFAAIPSVGRFLPGKAGDALAGRPDELLLAPAVGAAVLIAWTLALAAAAVMRNDRSDA